MRCFYDWWQLDGGFRNYYDPSETSASFYLDPASMNNDTWNIARSPALTTPTCCDVGASSDYLTAQERTIENRAPGVAPGAYTSHGNAQLLVTPPCPQGPTGFSCWYHDGRRSMQVTTSATAPSGVRLTRRYLAAGTQVWVVRPPPQQRRRPAGRRLPALLQLVRRRDPDNAHRGGSDRGLERVPGPGAGPAGHGVRHVQREHDLGATVVQLPHGQRAAEQVPVGVRRAFPGPPETGTGCRA